MEDLTDEQLMLLVQDGDHQAFNNLFDRHKGRLMGYLTKKTGSTSISEEIFQKTFETVYTKAQSFKVSFKFSPWLFTIASNNLIDLQRKKKDLLFQNPSDAQEIKDDTNYIYNSSPELPLNELDSKTKLALEMRYWNEQSYSEISKTLNISEAGARKVISRALNKLRSTLKKEGV